MARLNEPAFSGALTETLEALAAAELATWRWDPAADRVSFSGAVQALGLSPLAPDCSAAALIALVAPAHQGAVTTLFEKGEAGSEISARINLVHLGGERLTAWRGAWLEDGCAAGVVSASDRFVETGRDGLTGLLNRTAFLANVEAG